MCVFLKNDTHLGIVMNIVVPSCWGFKFNPEFWILFNTSGISCGKVAMFKITVLGFFLLICATSWSACSSPSTSMRIDSIEPGERMLLLDWKITSFSIRALQKNFEIKQKRF